MTLVVARQIDGEVFLVADTKFTAPAHEGKSNAEQYIGGLKLVLLNPAVCVAFSGNIHFAQNAIQGIYRKNVDLFDKNALIDYFLSHHRLSRDMGADCEVDFVLAFSLETPNGAYLKELFSIKDGEVRWDNQATYVGDAKGFDLFQATFHRAQAVADGSVFELTRLGSTARPTFDGQLTSALRAMQVVIDDSSITLVDGLRTAVVSEGGRFRYLATLLLRGTPRPVRAEPNSPVTFGDAASGSDNKYVGIGASPICAVMGAYSYTGRFGIIYRPVIDFEPLIAHDCSIEQFHAEIGRTRQVAEEEFRQYEEWHSKEFPSNDC
jgi:hypothetical protein